MQDITPASSAGASPFDGIRRTTPEGREYWSARDLMPLLDEAAAALLLTYLRNTPKIKAV